MWFSLLFYLQKVPTGWKRQQRIPSFYSLSEILKSDRSELQSQTSQFSIKNLVRSDSRRKRSEGPPSGAHGGGERKQREAQLPQWDKISKDNVSADWLQFNLLWSWQLQGVEPICVCKDSRLEPLQFLFFTCEAEQVLQRYDFLAKYFTVPLNLLPTTL